jgi:hypothetical protein
MKARKAIEVKGKRGPIGRPYVPRPCVVCSAEAQYAFSVFSRTVGLGQGPGVRKMKTGCTKLLCGRCSKDVALFLGHLGDAANDSLRYVRRPPQRASSASLFDQAEA